jgi:protein-S-isoprenylcysteine O-methyltransferase Ste14
MKKIDFFGAGPKIGRIALPYFAVTIALACSFPSIFCFGVGVKQYMMIAGAVLLACGLVCYGLTIRSLLKGLKETRLITTGLYSYCQNPLYAVIMLLFIPGIALMLNSWLVLTTTIAGYLVFKRLISQEYNEMTELFGEEYKRYKETTPEFFPFFK